MQLTWPFYLTKQHFCSQAGRTEHVKPVKEQSLFWHWVWQECGKPRSGQVYGIMKKSWHQYHYAMSMIRKYKFETKCKLAENYKNDTHLWTGLRKTNPKSWNIPLSVVNVCVAGNIAKLFKEKYENFYTNVPTDDVEIIRVRA